MKFDIVTQWVIASSESPTCLKCSRQGSSELHVQTRQREYGAGGNENAGCGIEPRNMYSRGHEDNAEGMAESRRLVAVRKAAVLITTWQVLRTPPGS